MKLHLERQATIISTGNLEVVNWLSFEEDELAFNA
jgi:hypothetical protein